ncbi:Metallo-dependent phosphatase-like protein [Gautieria morchelliformis]|nr:Metallo-dependent phosphatase-like protein [Gautieria morchelliformis]
MCAEYASRCSWLATALVTFAAVSAARAAATAESNVASTKGPTRTSSSSVFFATPPASLDVPADFTAQPFFVTDFLNVFYSGFGPSQTSVEPQPVITDPVGNTVFPLNLTNPKTIPTANVIDPVVLPPSILDPSNSTVVSPPTANHSTAGSIALRAAAFAQISEVLNSTTFGSTCAQCTASLLVAKNLALTAPWEVPPLLIQLCNLVKFSAFGSCEQEFSANSDGQIATQLLANADVAGLDGQWICAKSVIPLRKSCPTPAPTDLTSVLSTWFAKPKPANATAPASSKKAQNLRVLHVSDFDFLCCRPGGSNFALPPGQFSLPAPRFGAYDCDTPWNLAGAVLHAIGPLTGTGSGVANASDVGHGQSKAKTTPPAFTVFTGDLTSHDNDNQLSRAYVEYVESAVYSGFKAYLGGGPVYAAMGNHDTWPQAFDAPHSIQPEQLANQFEWNYGHLADLWQTEGWISEEVANVSKATYSAYSTVTPQGLKIITMNTDFWYNDNFINTTNPDVSGMLRFVTDELQAAEDSGQRVWILGHVLPGALGRHRRSPNGPNLFYQIIDRFSPHVIANVFMGHIHDEVRYLYYANNGTTMDAQNALTTTWVGGSVTPLTGLNSGFSMYEVDSETFDVMEAYTWFANVSAFPELDSQTEVGAAYHFEYSTREEYGGNFTWPADAPLKPTSLGFLANPELVDKWTLNQGRQSVRTTNCTSTACQEAKVCYIRSGSPPIAARCTKGFGSVQN